jgi:hypothetical protein
MKALTLADVKNKLSADTYSLKNGVFTLRRSFFYTGGFTADMFAGRVLDAFPGATIIDSGEVWKAFRGGAPVAQGSHWFVKFSVAAKS